MKSIDVNTNLVDSYFALLKSLSPNNKLELIARLSNSLKTSKTSKSDNSLKALFGSWKSDQSADQLIEELMQARKSTRKIDEL